MIKSLGSFRRDARGTTIVEFAVIAPVMLMLIMGMCDLSYRGYMQSVLSGAIQKAGRDSTIEGSGTVSAGQTIDQIVMKPVRAIAKGATYVSTRKSYSTFGAIAPEPFQDNNGNGVYDAASECFTDVNGNNTWDADPGLTGQGGASDVVVYNIDVTYPRLFPLSGLIGLPPTQTISGSTVLKNQPYKEQNAYTPTLVCP